MANPDRRQQFQFKLRVVGTNGAVSNPTFEIDQAATQQIPVEVKAGQTLLVERNAIARIYDVKGSQATSMALTGTLPVLSKAKSPVIINCEFQGEFWPLPSRSRNIMSAAGC